MDRLSESEHKEMAMRVGNKLLVREKNRSTLLFYALEDITDETLCLFQKTSESGQF